MDIAIRICEPKPIRNELSHFLTVFENSKYNRQEIKHIFRIGLKDKVG